jgi:hypothetical protein
MTYTALLLLACSQVQYAALSHFEEKHEDFIADTVMLRRRFTPDGGWVGAQSHSLSAPSMCRGTSWSGMD